MGLRLSDMIPASVWDGNACSARARGDVLCAVIGGPNDGFEGLGAAGAGSIYQPCLIVVTDTITKTNQVLPTKAGSRLPQEAVARHTAAELNWAWCHVSSRRSG